MPLIGKVRVRVRVRNQKGHNLHLIGVELSISSILLTLTLTPTLALTLTVLNIGVEYIDVFNIAAGVNDLSPDAAHFFYSIEFEIARVVLHEILSLLRKMIIVVR
jgi:hypothetical protein